MEQPLARKMLIRIPHTRQPRNPKTIIALCLRECEVWDQRVGGSNPSAPTISAVSLWGKTRSVGKNAHSGSAGRVGIDAISDRPFPTAAITADSPAPLECTLMNAASPL